MLTVWQPPIICNRVTDSLLQELDNNVSACGKTNAFHPVFYWSPPQNAECRLRLDSPAELNKLYPEFSAKSKYFPNYTNQLFESMELKNFRLLPGFPETQNTTELPVGIQKYFNQLGKYIDAYRPND